MLITEKELIIPALKALRNAPNGTLTTTQLIQISKLDKRFSYFEERWITLD